MHLTVIGTGYVGLVTGALFADRGNKVICVDNNSEIVQQLNQGKIHIFEPGLESIIQKSVSNGNLSFTTDLGLEVKKSEAVFLTVGTPSDENGSFNLKYIEQATIDLARELSSPEVKGFKALVVKSTVPQGTYEKINSLLTQQIHNPNLAWGYVSNPETLAEGTAIADFSKPDRIIIGTYSKEAFALMEELYHPFNIQSNRIMRGSPADAELTKLFSNTALATRIAMINEMAHIADIIPGADMDTIRKMMCEDSRIGYKFMFPSPGYGGSCFPKDIQGLVAKARELNYNPILLGAIHPSNETHKNYIGERITKLLSKPSGQISRLAVWGLTFKPNTDDMRDAASIPILTKLINHPAEITVYDPQDKKAREIFKDKIKFADNQYDAVEGADALILLTEWKQFDAPDYKVLSQQMRGRQLFDLRNRWLPKTANSFGFDYFGIGRNYPLEKHEK